MVDKVCPSRILSRLGLVEITSNTRLSSNGLFLKSQLETGKAQQEVLATQLARLLLPDALQATRFVSVRTFRPLVREYWH